jgi:hypothetical protein
MKLAKYNIGMLPISGVMFSSKIQNMDDRHSHNTNLFMISRKMSCLNFCLEISGKQLSRIPPFSSSADKFNFLKFLKVSSFAAGFVVEPGRDKFA